MAIIRNTASGVRRGRVGNTTYYYSEGRQVARVSQNSSNFGQGASRTPAQQAQRAKWSNLVQFYKKSAFWMSGAFESRRERQSDYNRFMQVNTSASHVYLTKQAAASGACVVAPYMVSEGSLPSISVVRIGQQWRSDLYIGDLSISANTTCAQLTDALLANNVGIAEGMQLSFIFAYQSIDANELPQINVAAFEMTLDRLDETKARDYIPALGLTSVDGAVGTSLTVPLGGFVWLLSDSRGGGIKVSTQSLVVNNAELLSAYTSEVARAAAMASYGVDDARFLASGSRISSAPSLSTFVVSVSYNARSVVNGGVLQVSSPYALFSFGVTLNRAVSSVTAASLVSESATVCELGVGAFEVSGSSVLLSATGMQDLEAAFGVDELPQEGFFVCDGEQVPFAVTLQRVVEG